MNSILQDYHRYTQNYPIPHLPISICMQSFNTMIKESLDANKPLSLVKELGRIAYCGSLPQLSNRESIREFIACVVYGMAVGIIAGPDGTRLLYRAQVAQAALPAKRKWRKDPSKTDAKRPQTAPKQPQNSAEPIQESTT